LLLFYSISLGCRFLLEQPHGSTARYHPRLSQVFDQQTVYETRVWGGAWADDVNSASPKPHLLYSNDQRLLFELYAAGGHLTGYQLQEFGQSLVKRQKKVMDLHRGLAMTT